MVTFATKEETCAGINYRPCWTPQRSRSCGSACTAAVWRVEKLCERMEALRCELLTLGKQRNVRGGARVEQVRKAATKWHAMAARARDNVAEFGRCNMKGKID